MGEQHGERWSPPVPERLLMTFRAAATGHPRSLRLGPAHPGALHAARDEVLVGQFMGSETAVPTTFT